MTPRRKFFFKLKRNRNLETPGLVKLGITASAARILSPKQTRRPLPRLLIQYFLYGYDTGTPGSHVLADFY